MTAAEVTPGRQATRLAASTRSDASRRVTEADVAATYEESSSRLGEESFIRFFEATLDMNLGALERIIIYVMAAQLIGRGGDAEQFFRRSALVDAVNGWFGKTAPEDAEYDEAFDYLEMTGMLVSSGDLRRMAFPSHAHILLRLEEANMDQIQTLVRDFKDKKPG